MSTYVITGANRGIGLELAKQLADRGEDVVAAVRKGSDELRRSGVRIEEGVDVTDRRAVDALAKALGDTTIDVLINNAGLLEPDDLADPDGDAIRRQFEINALGPIRVTSALLGRMGAGSRIALITSRMGSIADNTSGGMYGYRMSKAALNMAGMSMAQDLKGKGIAVGILHPGMVATQMTERFGDGPQWQRPAEAAEKLIARIDEISLETSGSFRHANGEALPW